MANVSIDSSAFWADTKQGINGLITAEDAHGTTLLVGAAMLGVLVAATLPPRGSAAGLRSPRHERQRLGARRRVRSRHAARTGPAAAEGHATAGGGCLASQQQHARRDFHARLGHERLPPSSKLAAARRCALS